MEDNIKLFKTIRCPESCKKQLCPYYHSAKDRRRKIITYLPYLCLEAVQNDFCLHEDCSFCSNYTEFLYHPSNFQANKCINKLIAAECSYGIYCPYKHSEIIHKDERSALKNEEYLGGDDLSENKDIGYIIKHVKNMKVEDGEDVRNEKEEVDEFKYIQGKELKIFEDRHNEFKDTKAKNFDISMACQNIATYVSAFLNTEGGKIYYGISDSGVVSGIKLVRRTRDLFTQSLDGILNRFDPPLRPDLYKITYQPVYAANHEPLNNTYIIEIEVKQGYSSDIYFTHKKEAYIRRDSSVNLLKGPALIEFSRRRQPNIVNNIS